MSQIAVPLGDGSFVDLGQSSLNTFGVEIPYLTDQWGGDAPANIPNPPLGGYNDLEPALPGYVLFVPYGPPPIGCAVGCAPPIDRPDAIAPEPGTAVFLFIALLTGIFFRKGVTCLS